MKKYFGIITLLIASLFILSCSSDDEPDRPAALNSDKTIVVFFPYTGNLYGYLSNNLADMERAMLQKKHNPNVLVYMNSSKNNACLFSVRRKGNICVHDTLRVYEAKDNTSADELASLFSEIKSLTPQTRTYNMIVGCHGMGWIYSSDYATVRNMYPPKYFGDESNPMPVTRWMGGGNARIDIDKFAEAMNKAMFHTHLMLFDVCYMANIESVYELRNTTDYIVASPIEIMGKGMPYQIIWDEITESSPASMGSICSKVYDFYKNSDQPYCSLSAIDCSRLENLAGVVKEINQKYPFDASMHEQLQVLDGYGPSLFYDMGRYVDLQCNDAELRNRYMQAFNEAVFVNYHTDEYYTSLSQGKYGANAILYCSGLTTSAPSVHKLAEAGWKRTHWYGATH